MSDATTSAGSSDDHPLFLIDRISLPAHTALTNVAVQNMRDQFLGADKMKPDFVQDELVWDAGQNKPTGPETMEHFNRASVVRAFADLCTFALPEMEKLTAEIDPGGKGWELKFAGRVTNDPDITRTIVYHFWTLPSYDSVLDLMYALREKDWYIVLQQLIELEQQSLAKDSTVRMPAVEIDPDPDGTGYLLMSQRVHPINHQASYEYAADYIDRMMQEHSLSLGLRVFVTTGDLGTQRRLYVGPMDAPDDNDIPGAIQDATMAQQTRLFHPSRSDLPTTLSQEIPYLVESTVEVLEPMPYCPHYKHLVKLASAG